MRSTGLAAFVMAGSLLAAAGCGGGSGAGSCGAAPTCGGALDGTWTITSTCIEGDPDRGLAATADNGNPVPAACNSLFQGFTVDVQGSVTIANNVETDNVTLTMSGKAVYSSACVSALSGTSVTLTASLCTALQSSLTSGGDFNSATCAFAGTTCTCDVVKSEVAPTTPQPFTVSGSHITYANPASTPMDYCVTGTTMTVRQEAGLPNVFAVNVLQKS
jgi:hypothetical protein